ncbi:MAG: hypothetical protein AMJ65_04095 [Phycisphaerae bacterium SG8_4]|nr:MAG: hypothetical protein AMJ65_04095 [Phycisphaerae bacterium SG8_4]
MLTAFLCLPALCFCAAAAETEQKLLGDESDGSRAHPIHQIPLIAEEGDQIGPDDDPLLPFSTKQTCGGVCHSYDVIATGWHFSAADANVAPGRPGEPWILADGRSGTQIPISHRAWPGTFTPKQAGLSHTLFLKIFGRHLPGGGVGELEPEKPEDIMRTFVSGKLEINCLSCHDGDPGNNQAEYDTQLKRENFRWAAAATTSFATVTGSAKDMPDTWDPMMPEPLNDPKKVPPGTKYRPNTFGENKNVLLNVVRETPANRCYFCHSNMYLTDEHTEKWTGDEDIHMTAGLTCVDCHRNGTDHEIVRGYEGESETSKNPLAATTSCRGCHLPGESGEVPEAGRLGAPVPEHKGLPPVHLEKLTCTVCHSGPWPGDETILVKTSRAHRLGTIGVNKSHEALPHLVTPVYATGGDGKIAPHKMIWPSYWAGLTDDGIVPVAFETVISVAGAALADVERPVSGDWPALTMDNIVTGLKAIADSVEGKPVYISGGSLYGFDDSGDLYEEKEHPAARPYMWAIGHDVRPAAQSLGARRCEDCHSPGAPFFFGRVAVDSPVAERAGAFVEMNQLHEVTGPTYVAVNKFFKYMIIIVMTLLILHIMGDLFRRVMNKIRAK